MHKPGTLLALLFFALINPVMFSQITSVSGPVHACAPATITFSAPAGTSSANWNCSPFGTYTTTTGNFNVVSPASFTAVFTGIVNGSSTTFSVPVTVHAKPVANFTIIQPSNSCVVKTVTLTDQSTSSSTITSWLWTYGDGGSGTSSGTHTYGYTLPGTYSVSLKVIDAYGCENQVTIGTVSVTTPPSAVISSNPSNLSSCASSFSAAFSASNSTGSGLSYNWNFGNSQTSTQMSPGPITFSAQQNSYQVTLTVTANGCNAYASTFVSVSPTTLNVIAPATVCANAAPVVTLQSNQSSTTWNMGNGSTVSISTPPFNNPTVTIPSYTAPGIYTITVSAGSGQCSITPVTLLINVQLITANFTAPPPYITCNQKLVVTYSNQSSSNATQFLWSFVNANLVTYTSSASNPTFTYNNSPNNPYSIQKVPFTPTITLVALSANGCSATVTKTLHTIENPTAWFYKNKREGCSPLIVTFRDSSFAYPSSPISSYTWCNGATPAFSVSGTAPPISPQTFTYTNLGVYRPYLIIKTSAGCIDTSFIDTVIVAAPPVVSFSFTPSQACVGQTVQVVNTTPNTSSVQHWHVDSDNGFFSGCVSDPNPVWKFTHTGLHTFTISGYRNGCKGQAVSSQSILIKGPAVQMRYETNCTSRLSVNFNSILQEVQTATLNFGDNSSATFTGNATGITSASVAHSYSATGDYTATLTGVNLITGCAQNTYTLKVRVRNAVSSFTAPSLVCAGNAVAFNGTASTDVFFGCSRGYVWYYDNDPPQDGTSPVGFHTFSAPGTHTVSLMVKDLNSCSDISTKTLTVSDVTPAFSLSSSLICHSGTVMITNNTSHTPDSIASYNWNFGNGQTLTTTLQTVPVQTYTFANVPFSTYNIFLTATNKKGCSKMATQQLKVVKPNASFIATPQGMCVSATTPTTVTFIAQGAHPSYTFNYGSSTQSAIVTSSISTYTFSPGNYTVTMTVLDTSGCVNSSSLTINAVQVPVADFTFTSPGSSGGNNICAPNPVVFTNVSLPQPYTANWSIPNQTLVPLNKITVSFSVTSTTAITVSMSVNTGAPYFCSATAAKNFTVYIAKANIVASKTLVCLGDEVMFSIDTANGGGVKSWVWDFGDASSTTTVQAVSAIKGPVPHKYSNYSATAAGNVTTSLIYYSSGDVCRYSAEIPVKIINVVAGFKRNSETVALDSVHCLKIPDRFNSISTTNDKGPLSYSWSFPGGNTYSDSLVNHTFAQPGTQQVSLTVTEPANNCKATAVKSMTIFGLPTATITPAQVCPNKPFTLTVTASPAVNSATWAAGSGIIGSMQFTTASNPFYSQGVIPATTVYSLMVSDTNNCASENVMQEIEVMKPPPVVNWDTAVVIGERIPLNGYVGNFTYSWTPFNSHLSCTACASPVSTTTDNATYTVMVEDLAHCAIVKSIYKIEILPRSSVDVPGAFTPNGDGINDRIFVGGWGIKNLNYFRIFNRWGQLLFESSDISVGWDGTYNGVPQNIDTYIYQVSVDNYIDTKPLLKSSTFKLLR